MHAAVVLQKHLLKKNTGNETMKLKILPFIRENFQLALIEVTNVKPVKRPDSH